MAKNKLLFSTPVGGIELRPGETKVITRHNHHDRHHDDDRHHDKDKHHDKDRHHGGIEVRDYEVIRVVADNRITSETSVILSILTSIENGRTLGRLARVRLFPGESYSQSFAVPGQWLNIRAHAVRGCNHRGVDRIDVSVFGRK